ncbi:MAG: rubrerythrin family protein, partial [Firmicutes bacterium]|nr:rubrerythrin family protein [Bacillota bacterium]
MITDLAKSETKFNLMRAFAGESQARQRYGIAAAFAADEKLYIIQDAFLFTADQEQEHGEIFYDFLKPFAGRNLRVDADYPVDLFNTTLEFLRKAQENEMDEFNSIYRKFGEVAKE